MPQAKRISPLERTPLIDLLLKKIHNFAVFDDNCVDDVKSQIKKLRDDIYFLFRPYCSTMRIQHLISMRLK